MTLQITGQELYNPISSVRDTVFENNSHEMAALRVKMMLIDKEQKIEGWHRDMTSGGILLELENNHPFTPNAKFEKTLLMIEANDFSPRWHKRISDIRSSVIQAGDMLFLEQNKNTCRIDPGNGKELWNIKKKMYYALPEEKIGLFYPHSSSSKKMSAINLNTGETLWKKEQKRRHGWDDVFQYDPQTLLIASEGISLYNIYNGKNWNYQAKTSYNDVGRMILTNLLGFVVDLFFTITMDEKFAYEGYQNKVNTSSNIMSNVCIDKNGNLYLGSVDKIACISPKGKIMWSKKLPKKKTSKSTLFLHEGKAILLNRGYGNYNNYLSVMGEPYLASYDMRSGEKEYQEKIFSEKYESIDNFQVINNTLFVITGNHIQTYDLTNGVVTGELATDKIHFMAGEKWFVDSDIYVKDLNGFYRNILEIDPELVHVRNAQGDIISLDQSLSLIKQYTENETYHLYLESKDFTFLLHKGKTHILRHQAPFAVLPFEVEGFLSPDKTFFHFGRKEIWKIDLNRTSYNKSLKDWYIEIISRYVIFSGSEKERSIKKERLSHDNQSSLLTLNLIP